MPLTLMDIGTWALALAAFPQLKEVWLHKHTLEGYSFRGSFTTFVGLCCIALSFITMKMWISLAAQIIPLILWGTVSYYTRPKTL